MELGTSNATLYPRLANYVGDVVGSLDKIPAARRASLDQLAAYVRKRSAARTPARLTFICTHNSRRSHMSQLWAAVAAAYYGVEGVETFSGGTEATAFNPRAVAALERAGLQIRTTNPSVDNPHYMVSYAATTSPMEVFSKTYDSPPNPTEDFVAVMTCSEADRSCPTVKGASYRVAVPYVDPKVSDGTPEESETYDARARQIAAEMFYVFSKVAA